MKVTSIEKAWEEADKLFPTDYIKDDIKTEKAGYNIYISTAENNGSWISELGDRLEVNLNDGTTVNIWIEKPEYTEKELDEVLDKVDDILYDLEDNFATVIHHNRILDEAHRTLYNVFKKAKEECDKFYPESYLYEKYNLHEA